MKPLAGVRVLDFTWVGAGPFTTKFLADQGADVIKVESISKPDGLRLTPPFAGRQEGINRSGYFADRNTNKRSLSLNMKLPEARALARRLVAVSDVVANNFTPGTMDRFGLSYEEVKEINARIIYLSMSVQGQDGPERDLLGYGLIVNGLTGLQHLTAFSADEPMGTGTNYPDHVPNPGHAAFAVLAALRYQRHTGLGQQIDVAQTEAMIALLGAQVLEYTLNGHDPQPLGNSDPAMSPHGVFPCQGTDRWIAIAAVTDEHWLSLAKILGIEAPADWATVAGRLADQPAVDDAVAAATQGHEAEELMRLLQAAGVAAGVVNDIRDVVQYDPQLVYRGHWVRLPHAEIGDALYGTPPFQFSRTPVQFDHGAPLLGEHTSEICRELLGMSDQEITDLVTAGVLA